jgi:3-oxoacyl-(acyl-carrier-protein) synthase
LAFVALEQQGVFRPWRIGGKGPVPGEGAAFLVLESQRRAEARGARIYARVGGYRLGTRPRDANGSAWYSSLVAPLVSPLPAAIVSAAEDGAAATDGTAARTTVKPKASVGNLFAAAAALQVALGAALARRLGPGARVLANCFGHGTEQAAFLLEAV